MPQSESALPAVSPLRPAPMTQVRGDAKSGIEPSLTLDSTPCQLHSTVRLLLGRADADRAGDAGAAQAAVPVGVLGQVLLVVVLGVVERAGGRDLGGDLAVAGGAQALGEELLGGLDGLALGVVGVVGRGAVLAADIVALPHALGRVMALPEDAQDLLVAGLGGVEHHEDGLRMAGAAAADLLVGR